MMDEDRRVVLETPTSLSGTDGIVGETKTIRELKRLVVTIVVGKIGRRVQYISNSIESVLSCNRGCKSL